MRQSWSSMVVGFVCVLALTFAAASGASAQAAPAQQAPPAAASAGTYPGDVVVLLNYIQNDKAADFEMVMGKVKEALQKSTKDERKKQAEGWRVFKSPDPSGMDGITVYVTIIDPVVKGADYRVGTVLSEGFPQEYTDVYKKYSDSYNTGARKLVPINLNAVISFK
jgi:hypothetical protein